MRSFLLTVEVILLIVILPVPAYTSGLNSTFYVESAGPTAGSPSLSFSSTTYNFSKTSGTIDITVNLSFAFPNTVTVDYQTTNNGTALAGTDFISKSGVLIFNPGETSKNISITVRDDGVIWHNKRSFGVLLSDANTGIGNGYATVYLGNNPGICLTFDDAYVDDWYHIAYPLMQEYGAKGTFYVVTSYAFPNLTEVSMLQEMSAHGMDIGSHTYYHRSAFNYTVSDYLSTEIIPSIDTMSGYGLKPYSFSYPFGQKSEEYDAALLPYFNTLRVIGIIYQPWVYYGWTGNRVLNAAGLDQSYGFPIEDYYAAMDNAVATDTVLVLYSHDVADEVTRDYQTSTQRLHDILQYAADHQMSYYTMNDLVDPHVPDSNNVSFSLSASQTTVSEGDGPVVLTVTKNRTSSYSSTVKLSAVDGTATNGLDYTFTDTTLTFLPAELTKTVALSIKDDKSYEGTEDLTAGLSSPTGNATLGSPRSVSITIFDDPAGTFQFSSSSYPVDAANGSITLTVLRAGGSEGISTVDYATSDGTAIAGVDYGATNGTLVFNHGVTDRTIQVPILDPEATGSGTSFYVTLSDPNGGASIGTPKKATVTVNTGDEADEESFTYHLKKGWNLISIPIVPRDGNITTFFSPIMGNISIIWEYNSSNGTNAWAYYTTMTDKYEQGTLRSVNERLGYWVRCNNDTVFTVTGHLPQSSNVTLKSGWNLIGNPTLDIRQPLAAYPAEKIVWQFNSSNASSPWSYHTTVTDKYKQGTLTGLKPGYGYWVRIP